MIAPMGGAIPEGVTMGERVTGYDGAPYGVGDWVELHPANDMWMRGARFGTVTKVGRTRVYVTLSWPAEGRAYKGYPDSFRRVGGEG